VVETILELMNTIYYIILLGYLSGFRVYV